jgi:hypothetical protein
LVTGTYVVPGAQEVYFPLGHGRKMYGFEGDLGIVDIDLLNSAETKSKRTDELLRAMKVLRDNPYTLISNHILKKHKCDDWLKLSWASILGHVRYIKDNLDEYLKTAESRGQSQRVSIEVLSNSLWLGTKQVIEKKWNSLKLMTYI